MKRKYDISDFVSCLTEQEVKREIVKRLKQRRKELNLSQQSLAIKSGVSYASIRRFETCGEISFSSLLKIADAINCLNDFNLLFSNEIISDLEDY